MWDTDVIVYIGESNLDVSLKVAKRAKNQGPNAIGVVSPCFCDYNEEETLYFQKILNEITIPVFCIS